MSAWLEGKLVRLVAQNKETDAELYYRWNSDSEFQRLSDLGPSSLYPAPQIKEWIEESNPRTCNFIIETIAEKKRIGSIGLDIFNWSARSAWVGIGIGENDYLGKGFGSEAMDLILDVAFGELNLHRVQLGVFQFNERAKKSYEKCGFRLEGAERAFNFKRGQRCDVFNMGILQDEWRELRKRQREM